MNPSEMPFRLPDGRAVVVPRVGAPAAYLGVPGRVVALDVAADGAAVIVTVSTPRGFGAYDIEPTT